MFRWSEDLREVSRAPVTGLLPSVLGVRVGASSVFPAVDARGGSGRRVR